jgi:hypothetical protein
MPNWRFWEKQEDNEEPIEATLPGRTALIGERVPKPLDSPASPPTGGEDRSQRSEQLKRRREGAMYDLSQAEHALEDDNPWLQRVQLLTEALEAVERDLEVLDNLPKRELPNLPATQIEILQVKAEEPAAISFRVGDQTFLYEEDLDWAERGGPIVHGELQHRSGDPEALVPESVPPELKSELIDHLVDSLFVFATDLRDRTLSGEPLPAAPKLSDLARPCPECGGWQDWRGNCSECKRRQWRRQQLEAEGERLDAERTAEMEDQAKWSERLPVARKRLAEIDAEIAALGGT